MVMGNKSIAERWRELSGENNWEGLLNPLDGDLRRIIIHYGDCTQAVSNAINKEKTSKWYGFSRYPMENFFSDVGLEKGNPYKYKVTKFFHARSEIQVFDWISLGESSWNGYVAVATDEGMAVLGRRDILIAWRGTVTSMEAIVDMHIDFVSAVDVLGEENGDPKVHHGWHSIYTAKDPKSTYNKTSAREQVLSEVARLVELYKEEEISITVMGHSLGGAVATLKAVDIVANGYNKPAASEADHKGCMVTAIVFASPRVGNSGFAKLFSELNGLHVLRIENALDIVHKLPQLLYSHVGKELDIDTRKSPYIKDYVGLIRDKMIAHQLEPYLHGVAGTQGANREFELEVGRDLSLLNKHTDALRDEYKIPVEWWTEKYKGMVQQDNGSWKLDDYEPDPPTV